MLMVLKMPDEKNKFAEPFREMAARIERNLLEEFAGAVLIVPPTGEPIALMIADPKADLGQFWGTVMARIQVATMEYEASRRDQNFGRR